MCILNNIGSRLSRVEGVKAMTDVTGFGLMGHLSEMCEGSGLSATVHYDAVPKLPEVENYLAQGCTPGGAQRNFDSYGHKLAPMSEQQQKILCDPQTSGGLLVAVSPHSEKELLNIAKEFGLELNPIGHLGELTPGQAHLVEVI
jgi:selenide,water dikinase